ncbi:MAG TPA: ORF6N domain-containing protein [Flavobacterium sp.]|nr:ORF6N domain-containing protein [Flavobacterium sp.]HSD08102.1 ORF6N domain-containing protein [Flavobacterium sp.]
MEITNCNFQKFKITNCDLKEIKRQFMENEILLSEELISNKIYFIRNQKVMLDRDLATLYGIETKRLKEQVKRNISRFPEDFMSLQKKSFQFGGRKLRPPNQTK